jgi:hypothetical protein
LTILSLEVFGNNSAEFKPKQIHDAASASCVNSPGDLVLFPEKLDSPHVRVQSGDRRRFHRRMATARRASVCSGILDCGALTQAVIHDRCKKLAA